MSAEAHLATEQASMQVLQTEKAALTAAVQVLTATLLHLLSGQLEEPWSRLPQICHQLHCDTQSLFDSGWCGLSGSDEQQCKLGGRVE